MKIDKGMQEIETKQRAILEIKKLKKGLTEKEQWLLGVFDKKYRDSNGRLMKGSFYISSDSKWEMIK